MTTKAVRVARYAWIVFALTFGLLISDYMSRQVLNAVFPLLKAEWGLSDGQLGCSAASSP
jgi:exosortase/archaeosortase